ncbi:tetratricopeptide repeat protein [Trichuris suis]|nr:tetratricopeptide repeat protein [Trichuris suis]
MKKAERTKISNLEREKAVAKAKKQWKTVASICNSLGELFVANDMFTEALEQAEEEVEVVGVHVKDADWIWSIRCKMVDYLNKMGDFEQAAKLATENRNIAMQSGNDTNKQDAEHVLGQVYMTWSLTLVEVRNKEQKKKYVQKAFKSFGKAMSLCANKNWPDVSYRVAAVLENIGVLNNHLKEYSKAIENFEKAIELVPEDRQLVGNALGEIVMAKRALGCDKAAESVSRQRVALFEGSENKIDWLESVIMLAHVLLSQEKYDEAAEVLRTVKPELEERSVIGQKIVKLLRQINSAHTLYRQIGGCKDSMTLYKLYEKLGDLFSGQLSSDDIKQHRLAIIYYGKMLDASSAAGVSPTSAYVSLSETYCDMEFYRDAYSHALKTYESESENPEEQINTALMLADLSEKADMALDVSVGWYKSALELASKMDKKDVLATVYHDWFSALQWRCTSKKDREAYDFETIEQRWNELKEFYVQSSAPSASPVNENEEETEEEDDGIDKEESSMGGEPQVMEGQPNERKMATSSRSKVTLRRNAVGESRLHRASIQNRLKTVLRLLEEKHPIDVVDNAGWTPLHEAANRGHSAVVKALIDHGADVNRPGMQGLTPLMDAAANGHWEVIRLLLEAKADVSMRDDTGRSVLDYINDWAESLESNIELDQEYLSIHAAQSCSADMRHGSSRVTLYRKRSFEDIGWVGSDEDVEEVSSKSSAVFPTLDEPGYGRKLYVEAVKSVGSRATPARRRSFSSDKSENMEEGAASASGLVTEEEFEAAEDFFIDDIENKRPKRSLSNDSTTFHTIKRVAVSLPSLPLRSPSSSIRSVTVDATSEPIVDLTRSPHAAFEKFATAQSETEVQGASILSSSRLVKVTVDNWTMAIPVTARDLADKTVRWLTSEAALRYVDRFGKKPVMTMFTSDNAELSPYDPLGVVLESEKGCLRCEVSHWEYFPPTRRLERICKLDGLDIPASVAEAFRIADESNKLVVKNCQLEEAIARSAFRALQYSSLSVIDLSGTVLTVNSILALGIAVGRMNSLEQLLLHGCCLSAAHLEHFYEGLSSAGISAGLMALDNLDLGCNPLGDESVSSFLRILSHCPKLKRLSLDNVQITGAFFLIQKKPWEKLLTDMHLELLDLRKNVIEPTALQLLKTILKHTDVLAD